MFNLSQCGTQWSFAQMATAEHTSEGASRAVHAVRARGAFSQDWRRTMVSRNLTKKNKRSYGAEQQQWLANSFVWVETCLLQPRVNGVAFLCGLQGALQATASPPVISV